MNTQPTPEDAINRRLDLISAQLQRIYAQLEFKPSKPVSPWLPLTDAAKALHFKSSRALRAAIDRGRIPPQFVRATLGETGKRRTLYVDVEGYASHLRHQ